MHFFPSSGKIVLLQAQVTSFQNLRREVIVLNKAESLGCWSELALQRVQVIFQRSQFSTKVWLLCHVFVDSRSIIVLSVRGLVSRNHLLSRALAQEVDINAWITKMGLGCLGWTSLLWKPSLISTVQIKTFTKESVDGEGWEELD